MCKKAQQSFHSFVRTVQMQTHLLQIQISNSDSNSFCYFLKKGYFWYSFSLNYHFLFGFTDQVPIPETTELSYMYNTLFHHITDHQQS